MLYHAEKQLSEEEFRNPGKEYRGAPFWAWNTDLRREELLRQIDELHEMGFGGFHMHARNGLGTTYLGKEFLDLVDACAEKAEQCDMFAYLYDEDRWPSGFAGGYVTAEHPEYRRRVLRFAPDKAENAVERIGRFDVELNGDGTLRSYRLLAEGEPAAHDEWFADVVVDEPTSRFNNATYVDTLNPKAVECFLTLTHKVYKKRLGKRFGTSVPAIFTDEPQFAVKSRLPFSSSRQSVQFPWTGDLPKTYSAAFDGEDLVGHLPELVWNLEGDKPSTVRWHYHDHVTERFAQAYMDQCGKWCDENGIILTGHMMAEDSLRSQTEYVGEAMRSYRGMSLPGIDMLCDYHHFHTAKQCQSAVHQYGREGMMSELYGVQGWDLDFRGHKHHGDWQAALGVTLRVPHLSFVSMEGDAKRDYPQTIHYQSPWYRKYPLVENHFARVNTAMTRGKAIVRVAVIHPIESFWLHYGAKDRNTLSTQQLETNFKNVTEWLLFGGVDFDYISESLFPALTAKGENPLRVGASSYDVVIVPECETLRSTTVERLDAFRRAGGKLIFLGAAPTAVDAIPNDRGAQLWSNADRLPFSRAALLSALESYRDVEFRNTTGKQSGTLTDNLLYQLRDDGNAKWLFIAQGIKTIKPDLPTSQGVSIRVRGSYSAKLYDTITGEIKPIEATLKDGWTELSVALWEQDSLLFRFVTASKSVTTIENTENQKQSVSIQPPAKVAFRLHEPNALLLDIAEYSLDGGEWQPAEEVLRIDTACRKALGWPVKGGEAAAQPWVFSEKPSSHRIAFRFTVHSEIALKNLLLAVERPQRVSIRWNGKTVSSDPIGYYVDRDIKTVALTALKKGDNILELEMPFEKRIPPECCYLLGDFGVRVDGRTITVVPLQETLGFGDIAHQGLAFYGGALTYEIPVELPQDGELSVHVPQFRAAVLEASLDNGEGRLIAFSPYTASIGKVTAGKHTLHLTAYINRSNTFGALHNTDPLEYYGPRIWRTEGDRWSYEYNLFTEGVIHSPIITLEQVQNEKN